MKCPVCKNHKNTTLVLHAEGFTEDIVECRICGSLWSVNHGITEMIRDPQARSFLEGTTECVDGDDYNLVA
ncbi:MAG: hypothetical protein IH614_08140 [Desulfuromonadales bacterium]|nr:hypothetical protein [Desulfuromonadales bacterium]